MARLFPRFTARLGRNQVTLVGTVTPFGCSEEYRVVIEYKLRTRPSIWVLKPALRSIGDGITIPHTFSDGSLCLHTPGQWQSDLTIAEYIVPWTVEWLLYYETWLATGEWLGGGEHPERKAKR
jgi:hypothetical protein